MRISWLWLCCLLNSDSRPEKAQNNEKKIIGLNNCQQDTGSGDLRIFTMDVVMQRGLDAVAAKPEDDGQAG
jgi:hypothetical protein